MGHCKEKNEKMTKYEEALKRQLGYNPARNYAAAAGGGKRKSKHAWKNILAGGIAGGIEICITYPTEFVKTQLQLDEKARPAKYNGTVDCAKQHMRQSGIRGLYKGLPVLLLGSVPKTAVRFSANAQANQRLQSLFPQFCNQNKVAKSLLAGLIAGVSEAILIVCPMETVKVRFINDFNRAQPQFRSLYHGCGVIIKQEGLGGLYKGLTATVLKQGTNQMMRFGVYESCWSSHFPWLPEWTPQQVYTALYGGLAGAISVVGNTPLDVIKTRMQGLDASRYKNTLDCAKQTYRNEGLVAFYKGTLPRMTRVVIDVAIIFVLYEEVLKLLDVVRPE